MEKGTRRIIGTPATRNDDGVPAILRFLWQIAGADPDILVGCAPHERAKFSLVGVFNILVAFPLAWLTLEVLQRFLRSLMIFASGLPNLAAASFFTVFATVGYVWLLSTGTARLIQRGRDSVRTSPGPVSPFAIALGAISPCVPAMVLGVWGTGLVFLISSPDSLNTQTLAAALCFQFIVLLSPLALTGVWKSKEYNSLMARASSPGFNPPQMTASLDTDLAQPAPQEQPSPEQQRARANIEEAFNRNPRNSKLGRALIDLHLRNGALAETLPVFDALISSEPQNAELVREKGSVYQKLGDDVRYRKTLEQADQIQARASFEQNVGKDFMLCGLEIHDLAFFGDFKWQFQPGLNILLGKNGYGKTHLLRALIATLQTEEKLTAPFFEDSGHTAMIRVLGKRDGEQVSTTRRFLVFDENFGKVPVLAIPDTRYIDRALTSIGAPAEPVSDFRSEGARHFLLEQSYEGLIVNFLYELYFDYLDRRRSFDAPIFRIIENAVNTLMRPLVSDPARSTRSEFKFHQIKRHDNARLEILVLTDGNESRPLPIQKASQGTLSLIAMIGLVYKFLKAIYPVDEEAIPRQRALVVIDEIDAHLHPSWQQRVISLFCETFPNVQFVVTAHSPLVVAGAREGEVAVLRRTPSGFVVEQAEGNFIGATAAQMYGRVFDIEEKDATYLRLGILHLDKPRIESEFMQLEQQGNRNRSPEDNLQYEALSAQLNDLREFESARNTRETAEQLERRNKDLEIELLRANGELSQLQAELRKGAPTGAENVIPRQDRLIL